MKYSLFISKTNYNSHMKIIYSIFTLILITISQNLYSQIAVSGPPLVIPAYLPGTNNNNYFKAGTGDGANLTTYNTYLSLHSGIGIGSPFTSNGSGGYIEKATVAIDGRAGHITTMGNLISTSGKLGLGVTNPLNTLDVLNGFAAGTETQFFIGQDHNFAANTGRYGLGLSFEHIDGTSAGKKSHLNIWFANEKKRAMTFNYLGYVGIGCTNPDARLTVKGLIHAEEVKVELLGSVCPDYVFESNYDLMSLSELEQYLKINKHLPEIPSAKEMEANGMYLREMNLSLLKKVEELTLHLITLKKENEILKAENKTLITSEEDTKARLSKIEAILSTHEVK
ncbi:MAG TPA: hypothetical protein VIM65_18730 [Cyclobacteriaceae bacterium]